MKELSLPISSSVRIVIELSNGSNSNINFLAGIDSQIDGLMSISSWLFSNKISHEIEWYNSGGDCGEIVRVSNVDELLEVLQQIYMIKPHDENLLLTEIVHQTIQIPVSHIIYITKEIKADTVSQLITLKNKVDVTVLYVESSMCILEDEDKLLLQSSEIRVIVVSWNEKQSDIEKFKLT